MKFAKVFAALLLSIASFSAQSIVITQSQQQTTAGQDFVFNFTGLSKKFTGNGTLTLTARGDYSTGNALNEYIAVSAESIGLGNSGYAAGSGSTTYTGDDTQWTRSFNLSNAQLVSLLSDNVLRVNAFLSSEVNLFNANSKVTVSFNYSPTAVTVPEPGSLLLVGIALAGLAAARRRKQ